MVPTGPAGTFVARRNALLASAAPGTDVARALSDLTDGVVSALAGAASSAVRTPFCVFALGGYGARRLLPHSDIDLLIVTDTGNGAAQELVRALLYPLWDAGLTVGHQVRRPADQARMMAEDVEVLTSFLTARHVAGDRALADQTVRRAFRVLQGAGGRKALAAIARRERTGSPYLLEPDLKEGAGGQRDLDELVWRAALEAGAPAATFLPLSLLADDERACLADAQDALTTARWQLHLHAGRGDNRMTLDAAEAAAVAADEVQRALECVHHTLHAVRARAAGAEAGAHPLRSLAELRALAEGPDAAEALETLAYHGGFEAAVPGFATLMTLRRPALSHRYTVGAHSLRALVSAAHAEGLTPRQADALLLAALTHDLGKREPGPGHAGRGTAMVPDVARALGADDVTAADAAVLVREHLLLSEVASGQDLSDEDVVLAAASRLGRPELVSPLFALTRADMQATGPDVWTPWRSTLVSELARKLEDALGSDVDGAGIARAAGAVRDEALRQAAQEGASRAVLEFIRTAPLRYLARRVAPEVLREARLVQSLAGPGLLDEVVLGIRPGPLPGAWLVDVVVRDRPGLFALVSGSLALAGLTALSAEAFTTHSGIAIDTFTVTSATRAAIEPSTWSALERALHSALRDPGGMESRLAARRKHYPIRSAIRPKVALQEGPMAATVRVRAADRVGLLHDLARALERAGLDIRWATITTTHGVARDTFAVASPDGEPLDLARLAETLMPLLQQAAASGE